MAPYRYPVFRLLDALTFGLPAALASVLALWAAATPGNGSIALVIASLAVLGFWGIYGLIIYRRATFSDSIDYVTKQGIVSLKTRYDVPQAMVEVTIEAVLRGWEEAIVRSTNSQSAVSKVRESVHGLILEWMPYPFPMGYRPKFNFTGFAGPRGILVGYLPQLEHTALGHELGHVILGRWRGDSTEEGLRAFTAEHGLPY